MLLMSIRKKKEKRQDVLRTIMPLTRVDETQLKILAQKFADNLSRPVLSGHLQLTELQWASPVVRRDYFEAVQRAQGSKVHRVRNRSRRTVLPKLDLVASNKLDRYLEERRTTTKSNWTFDAAWEPLRSSEQWHTIPCPTPELRYWLKSGNEQERAVLNWFHEGRGEDAINGVLKRRPSTQLALDLRHDAPKQATVLGDLTTVAAVRRAAQILQTLIERAPRLSCSTLLWRAYNMPKKVAQKLAESRTPLTTTTFQTFSRDPLLQHLSPTVLLALRVPTNSRLAALSKSEIVLPLGSKLIVRQAYYPTRNLIEASFQEGKHLTQFVLDLPVIVMDLLPSPELPFVLDYDVEQKGRLGPHFRTHRVRSVSTINATKRTSRRIRRSV